MFSVYVAGVDGSDDDGDDVGVDERVDDGDAGGARVVVDVADEVACPDAVALAECDGDGEADSKNGGADVSGEGKNVLDCDSIAVLDGVAEADAVADSSGGDVCVAVCVCVHDPDPSPLGLAAGDTDVANGVPVDGVPVAVEDADAVGVGTDADVDATADRVGVGVWLATVCEAVGEFDGVAVGVFDGVTVAVGVAVGVTVPLLVCVGVVDSDVSCGVSVIVDDGTGDRYGGVPVSELVGVPVAVCDCTPAAPVPDGVADTDEVEDAVADAMSCEAVGVGVFD